MEGRSGKTKRTIERGERVMRRKSKQKIAKAEQCEVIAKVEQKLNAKWWIGVEGRFDLKPIKFRESGEVA